VTLAEIARELGGDIYGPALHTNVDGIEVEITRARLPLTGNVTWHTRVFCNHRFAYPHAEEGELLNLVDAAQPDPELPGHVFGGFFWDILHAASIGEPTLDDLRATIAILVDLAKVLAAPRFEKVTVAHAKRRARIERLKRTAPRLLFVAAVTLVAYLIRRR
jgi:hypothetical protein